MQGVSQNPEPLAPVRGANVVRSQHTPLRIIPRFGQAAEYGSPVAVSKQTWDVLQEDESRSHQANNSESVRPLVPMIVGSGSSSGDAEGLARKSGGDNINHSLICFGKTFSDEGVDVSEDGSGVQKTVGDSLAEDVLAVRVVFDIAFAGPAEKVLCGEQAAARAGEQRELIQGRAP